MATLVLPAGTGPLPGTSAGPPSTARNEDRSRRWGPARRRYTMPPGESGYASAGEQGTHIQRDTPFLSISRFAWRLEEELIGEAPLLVESP